jgi:NADH dehydrogenase
MYSPTRVTLIDKRNFHLFQPLLYQVATGSLSWRYCLSLRWIVSRAKNIECGRRVVDILPDERRVILRDGELSHDA